MSHQPFFNATYFLCFIMILLYYYVFTWKPYIVGCQNHTLYGWPYKQKTIQAPYKHHTNTIQAPYNHHTTRKVGHKFTIQAPYNHLQPPYNVWWLYGFFSAHSTVPEPTNVLKSQFHKSNSKQLSLLLNNV